MKLRGESAAPRLATVQLSLYSYLHTYAHTQPYRHKQLSASSLIGTPVWLPPLYNFPDFISEYNYNESYLHYQV